MTMREELAQRSAEVVRLRDALNLAFAYGAKNSSAPEDRVIFPLLVACRDITEEILFAVSQGFGRLALRSVRTMYECVVFARFLSLHPERTDDYLATFHAQWAKVLENVGDAAKLMPDVHKVVAARVPSYAAGKRVDLDWSDASTLQMAEEVGIPRQFHAWAFNYASGFIHPSGLFLIRHLSQGEKSIEVGMGLQEDESRFALRFSHTLILNALHLRLKYAPSEALQQQIDGLTTDYRNVWGYPPPI
jgi:hypothetical protein